MRSSLPARPYRTVLDTPGIARAHEFQRLLSYGLAISIAFAVDFSGWRQPTIAGVASLMFAAAVFRLTTRRQVNPYALAQADLLVSGSLIAVGTSSTAITVPAVLFIVAAIAASFEVPRRIAALATIANGAPPLVLAVGLDATAEAPFEYLAALTLVVLALALTAFIIGIFAMRTRDLNRRLRHRESQLNAILDATPVLLAVVDPDMTMSTLAGHNPHWERDLGGVAQLFPLIESCRAIGRVTEDIEIGDRTFSITCDLGEDGEILLTVYDVTERTIARRHLEEVVRSKDQFIAAVSHELRTPLASVVGFSELIQEQLLESDPVESMMAEVADQSAEMAAIIDDLLVAARASFESVPTQPRQLNLADEAASVVETLHTRLRAEPESNLTDVNTHADPIRVRQIIRNLLTNADRYGGDDVRIETFARNGSAILVVRDSGDPLPPNRREAIFEPYESSGPVRGQPAAIGLGLSVSRTLAELMHGRITYDHDGTWSVFELELPANAVQISDSVADT